MASSPGNASAGTNPQNQPYDIHGFFKPSSSPYQTPPSSYPPPTGPFLHQQPHLYMPPLPGVQQQNPPENAHLHQQRSLSYPTPPLNLPSPRANNAGTHILALLNNNNGNNPTTTYQDLPIQPEISRPLLFSGGSGGGSGPVRIGSCKLPKGRRLVGDNVTYDVDVRLQGEVQPQLEVTPITKYGSDPQLVVGRQIAVNRAYICYGLKGGNIRVLNINTALRSLFRGHTQRVTDMCFFAEDVHLLASVSLDGRVFVWKISEGSEGEDQPQITGRIVLAVQILGEENIKHPRICWHSHKQEILVVAIGKCVLRIDTTKVGKREVFSADAPLQCPVDKLIVGVQLVGKHDGEVTDLSMCQWMTSRLASSSVDGTIKIWGDRKAEPLAVLRPHDGHPVNSATFLTAPERPDHIILFTGGVLNREIKIWVSANEEGWLLPSDAESWKCVQTLDLKSSAEPLAKEAFFNQVVALPQAGLFLLANAKKNAIYAVHIDYGSCPIQTSMDYIAEFTVTMPILSFTGTSDPPGDNIVKVYCVQTQAIQQYTLDLCLCLPPPLDNMSLEKLDSGISREDTATENSRVVDLAVCKTSEQPSADLVPEPSVQVSSSGSGNAPTYPLSSASIETTSQGVAPNGESRPSVLSSASSDTDTFYSSSAPHPPLPPIPVSPRLSRKVSGHQAPIEIFEPAPCADDQNGNPPTTNCSVDREMVTDESNLSNVPSLDPNVRSEEKGVARDASAVRNSPIIFKHPTHLVTPSEILMAASSADATSSIEGKNDGNDNIHNIVGGSEGGTNVGVKVGEARLIQNDEMSYREESQGRTLENREKIFCSQASDLSTEMARECHAATEKGYAVEDSGLHSQSSHAREEGLDSISENTEFRESDSANPFSQSSTPSNKGKKQKDKHLQGSGLSSPLSSALNLAETSNEQSQSSYPPYVESALPQISAMQEMLNQVLTSQREMQKQISSIISNPVAKEGKRLEAALGRCIEKVVKANSDALWARFQEEIAKNEKSSRDQMQQVANVLTNLMNKDLNAMFEKVVKKEIAAIGPAVVRTISPTIEKAISSSIADSFQRVVGDKAINQLEKSLNTKLEATVARQIQSQFQTSGRQTLQEALKSSLEASIIPAFELSCKTMFEQIDAAFQKGIVEHTATSRQHFESAHSQLALTLREAINSASSVAQTLSRELTDGQRNLIALATSGANSSAMNPLVNQLNNGPSAGLLEKVEAPLDPTKELSRLISEHKYDEAFTSALQRSDVNIVAWLCSQVDLHGLLSTVPLPLSQGVLLSLLQQLACDINKDTPRKLAWMTDVAAAINPADQMIMVHARPILEQVYHILHHQRSSLTLTGTDLSSIRLLVHVINSMLMSCK